MLPKTIFAVAHHGWFFSISIFIVWMAFLNYEGLKYSRVKATAPAVPGFSNCGNLLLELHNPDSWICCDESSHNHLWICSAANDIVTKFMSSEIAWVLPLFPVFLTMLVDVIVTRYKPSVSTNKSYQLNGLKRVAIYLGIILIRSIILYYIPYKVSEILFSNAEENCWAKSFVSRSKCQMTFDFSDHIVLFCVQYIYPSILEIFYIIHSHGLIVGGTEVTVGRTAYAIARNLYWIPLSVAILLIATSLRCMMFTILFFHNSLETVVALGVVFVFPYLFFLFGKQRNILEKEICSN